MSDKQRVSNEIAAAFREHRQTIYRYLLRRTRDTHQAEELTQRVFVDAATALARGDTPDSLLAWLYAVAERRFIDESRRRMRADEYLKNVSLEQMQAGETEYGPEVVKALRRGLQRLPEEQRHVVIMKIFEGKSFADIARRVGASEGACKMRFARGIRSLRDFLSNQGITP